MNSSNDLNAEIKKFCDYFTSQVDEITKIQSAHGELYRKLLLVGLLDTLAGTLMPRRQNKDRFISFTKRFCKWPDGDRVSLPHLVQLLQKNPDPVFGSLRKWALEKYNKLPVHGGELMLISQDPMADEVRREWPNSAEHKMPIEGIDLNALTHVSLLYTYRNALVHELRMLGYGMDFADKRGVPYYHGSSTVDGNLDRIRKTVELVYPWQFLGSLCSTGIDETRKYLEENGLNPYNSFAFGTYWLKELNR